MNKPPNNSRILRRFLAFALLLVMLITTLTTILLYALNIRSVAIPQLLMSIMGVQVLCIIISALYYRKLILSPIKAINRVITAGTPLSETIPGVSRTDEIGELASTISKMRQNFAEQSARYSLADSEKDIYTSLLSAVNRAAHSLCTAESSQFDRALNDAISHVTQAIDVDHLHIWKNTSLNSHVLLKPLLTWHNEKRPYFLDIDEINTAIRAIVPDWEKQLLDDRIINGPINKLPQTDIMQIVPLGIKSLLLLPVFLYDQFWGFFCFDDCHSNRYFNAAEVAVLREAVQMFAGAISQNDAAQQLRQADEYAKSLLDAVPFSCDLWNRDLELISSNKEAYKLFGLSSSKEYVDRFSELTPEYQPDGIRSAEKARLYMEAAFRDGKIVFSWMHCMPDGTPIPAEVTFVRIKFGTDYVVAAYTRDLREHIRAIRELEYKESLQKMLTEAAITLLDSSAASFEETLLRCAIIAADTISVDRIHIWKNHKNNGKLYSSQIYKWLRSGKESPLAKDIPFNGVWYTALSADRCINSPVREMPLVEREFLTRQGILSMLMVPIAINNQFWGFIGFDECRKERIFTADEEAVLRSGSLIIAHAIERNSADLALLNSLHEAQAASTAKSNFLSNMSHEMRTPMNAIIGMTAIGKAGTDLDKKDYALNKIQDASSHLLGVINDVLDMSKIEANKFELSEVEFNFERTIQKTVNVVNFRVEEKHQKFLVFLDQNIPQSLIGDDQRLTQVITNLLSNAVKFTPEGGTVRLNANLLSESDGFCSIEVSVTDTGIGISEEQQKRLFNSFEQADSTTTRKYGGTGLGLAISKHIVELMGGSIRIESQPGSGASFIFSVKLRPGNKYRSMLAPGVNWSNIRVLAVDDDPEMLVYFASIAAGFRIFCDTASGAADALRLIENGGNYNMYFVDWQMPDIDGIQLSQAIKAREPDNAVIIMMSAGEWNEIESQAKAVGVASFLPKPLFPSDIADCINNCLGYQGIPDLPPINPSSDLFPTFPDRCILLAEDVEINREIVLAMLEPSLVEIACAENGLQALELFSQRPEHFDMIFMDMQMPEMDGLEATRRIRALDLPNAKSIPIVAMTANVFREDIEKCIVAGMNDHVGKPLDFDEVISKMSAYLS